MAADADPASPMLAAMTPLASALLGLVLGAGIGALVAVLVIRRAARRVRGEIVNRHHLGEILDPLRAAVVVVSDSDRVIAASEPFGHFFGRRFGRQKGDAVAIRSPGK